ncbi:threonine aldolase family protein [Aurantibacter aestuarii]|uniref:Threonine aldolase n=1 Tax=Aurantibacter aestuarii TaxID=1266046 RepID=A0A2T1N8A2_9FLAO|nr:GntG family PLP-dependent aldolase [Aurantibacter aestuarii]PSG88043.1 threonine aldolase [Aurantibacter aestuarii]
MIIDLRSDTVTKPTKGMLDAMMTAKVGDDVYKEDETINALEEKLAKQFGKTHALFFPTGTMANQAAIKLHTQPGDQVICDKYAHIFNYEGGGASFNSGVSCRLLDGNRGMFTAQQVVEAINPPDFYHSPLTTLVEVENTTNKGGGACWDFEEIKKIRTVCDEHQLGFHLDGARLWNALIAKNETALDYGKQFDTISVCLSKGLGCPVGSVLVGNEAFMEKAIRIRKIFGGGMRQAGFLAAAGIYALDHQFERLAEDHAKAKALETVLNTLDYIKKVEPVETNIIIFELNGKFTDADFNAKMSAHHIRLSDMGQGKKRIVTHHDYTNAMHEKFCEVLMSL